MRTQRRLRRWVTIKILTTKGTREKISYITEFLRDGTEIHREKIIEDTKAAAPLGGYVILILTTKDTKEKDLLFHREAQRWQKNTDSI